MKISDIILDHIGSTSLFEMARSRADAKDIITSVSPQIFTHLVKLFVFNSPESKNHWIKEINGWLDQIDDIYLKPSNKKPDWQTVYNWLVFDSSPHYDEDYIDGKVKKWKATDYKNVQLYDYDASLVLNQVLKIIELATKDIAVPNKFTTVREYL